VGKLLSQLPARSALSSAFMANNALKKLGFGFGQDLTNDYRSLNLEYEWLMES
jgi:hypothetical protein